MMCLGSPRYALDEIEETVSMEETQSTMMRNESNKIQSDEQSEDSDVSFEP